jgi:hypothetical protein
LTNMDLRIGGNTKKPTRVKTTKNITTPMRNFFKRFIFPPSLSIILKKFQGRKKTIIQGLNVGKRLRGRVPCLLFSKNLL